MEETEESTDGFNGLRPEFHLNTGQISVCIHLSLQEMQSEIMWQADTLINFMAR